MNGEDEELLGVSIPVTLPLPPSGLASEQSPKPRLARLSGSLFQLLFDQSAPRRIMLFSVSGQRLLERQVEDGSAFLRIDTPGIYVLWVEEQGRSYSLKISR